MSCTALHCLVLNTEPDPRSGSDESRDPATESMLGPMLHVMLHVIEGKAKALCCTLSSIMTQDIDGFQKWLSQIESSPISRLLPLSRDTTTQNNNFTALYLYLSCCLAQQLNFARRA